MSENCRFLQQQENIRGESCDMTWQETKRRKAKTTYKHVPHREKAPHLVAQRNARERRRVQAVNSAFLRLRKHVPLDSKSKRLSKVRTLQTAIDYIQRLKGMIEKHDRNQQYTRTDYNQNGNSRNIGTTTTHLRNDIRWISLGSSTEDGESEGRPCCMYANYRPQNHSSG